MKYEDIVRLTDSEILDIRYREGQKIEGIKKIVEFYTPQINKLLEPLTDGDAVPLVLKTDKLEIKLNCGYNHSPHQLAVSVKCNIFSFNLEEMFNNCGMLVSCKTEVYYTNRRIGTLLHAIKEDIARLNLYSFMMYTDRVSTVVPNYNTKIILSTGAKEIFRGHNTRSYNSIAVWTKDLNEYYKTRVIKTVEVKESEVETSKQIESTGGQLIEQVTL